MFKFIIFERFIILIGVGKPIFSPIIIYVITSLQRLRPNPHHAEISVTVSCQKHGAFSIGFSFQPTTVEYRLGRVVERPTQLQ